MLGISRCRNLILNSNRFNFFGFWTEIIGIAYITKCVFHYPNDAEKKRDENVPKWYFII